MAGERPETQGGQPPTNPAGTAQSQTSGTDAHAQHPTGQVHAHHPHVAFRLLDELKHRNIVRVGILYLVVCWLILDPVHVVFHMLEVPAWANRLVVILMAVGFPAVLLFAWVYEITPEGLKPTVEVEPSRSIRRQTGQRLNRAIFVVMAVALAYFVVDKFWLSKHVTTERAATTVATVTPVVTPRSAAIGLVAVLPFENATGEPAIEYLSDGISESLINKLSSLNGLRVISRTSAFAFKGKKMEPTEIGRKLGVDALILGSLAQRGPNLAINAELVSVRDATQLWGAKYVRRADDVLQVEGEIAATIARTLRRQLSGEENVKLTRNETSDPEAYRLYLKGRDFLVGNQQEMDKSINYFQQAVARAPDYAMAHAGLAEAYTVQAFLGAAGRTEAVGKARAAVTRALELDPDLAEAHTALGLVRFYFEWDWAGAEAELRRALELNPGSQGVHEEYGAFLTAMGRLDEGLAQSREAARLDPISVGPVHDMALNALIRGNYEQAAAGFRHTIDIDPNWTWGYIKLARTLAIQKKCKEAFAQAEIAERKIAGGAAPLSQSWLGSTYAACGETARARQKLDELHALEKKQYVDPVTFAGIHSALGEMDTAMHWFEKAFEDRTPDMVWAAIGPRFSPELAGNPRYKAIVDRMGFPQPAK